MMRKARIGRGQRVLVNGATGAIGSAVVQLSASRGVRVTAVCDTTHLELVRGLGAERVIDRNVEDFTQDDQTYDVVFDAVGKSSFGRCRRLLEPRGQTGLGQHSRPTRRDNLHQSAAASMAVPRLSSSIDPVVRCGTGVQHTHRRIRLASGATGRRDSAGSAGSGVRHGGHLDVLHRFAWPGCVDDLPVAGVKLHMMNRCSAVAKRVRVVGPRPRNPRCDHVAVAESALDVELDELIRRC
jgi:threonine dehydrogenase-like Zn-dependent dehydrogenase